MKIREERIGDVTVVSVIGDFEARTAPQARAALDRLFGELRTRLVFNMSGMELVTSTAIAFLLDAAKRARKLGGDAVLSEPPGLLTKSLRSLDIGEHFRTFESDAEACAYFRDLALRAAANPRSPGPGGGASAKRPWWRFGK